MLYLCFGLYFLIRYSELISSNQNLYLICFTTSEIGITGYNLLINVLYWKYAVDQDKLWFSAIDNIWHDIVWVVYSLTLFFLTLDRFAEIYLNIKYEIYITRKKTLYAILGIWLTALVFGLASFSFQYLNNMNSIISFHVWLYLDIIILLSSIAIYSYIYRKCAKSKANVIHVSNQSTVIDKDGHRNEANVQTRVKKRKLFIPMLITIVFFLLVTVPDATYLILKTSFKGKFDEDILDFTLAIFYSISIICDVTIYILLQRNIRTLVLKKWRTSTRKNRISNRRNAVITLASAN